MNQMGKLCLLAAAFFAVIAGANVLYRLAAGKTAPDGQQTPAAVEAVRDSSRTGSGGAQTNGGEENSGPADGGTQTDGGGEAVTAPDFTMEDAQGNEISLSDFFGKPVVLNFWASWCPPCKGEMPHFQEAFDTYEEDIAFVMVDLTDGSSETVETATEFLSENGYTFPVYYDVAMDGAYAYAVNSIPATYFLDASGAVTAYQVGAFDREALFAQLEKLSA